MSYNKRPEEHTMTYPTATTASTATAAPDWKRIALWAVLVISAVGNVIFSVAIDPFIAAGFGVVTLSCGVALVRGHYRNRRRQG
jgi:hypothetical protein